jgi:trimethylamine:corrinoid methyltransferase-like protein
MRSAAAREVLRRAGAQVDEQIQLVRMGRDIVRRSWLSH